MIGHNMNWDEFIAKFDKISEKSENPDIIKIIISEFGSWEGLAFGILEMILYDRIKYNSICYSFSNNTQHGHNVVDAEQLDRRLAQFKRDFKGH